MSRPYMKEIKQYTDTVDTFAGLDRRTRISEGRFSSMMNMSSRKYPLISTRQKRGLYKELDNCRGLISKEKLCYVSGTGIYIGSHFVDMGLDDSTEKQLVSFGSYIVIFPDKKYINYYKEEDAANYEWGELEASFTAKYTVSAKLCKADGTEYTVKTYGDAPPDNPENGEYWADTSGENIVLKQYSSYSLSWVGVVSAYCSLTATNGSSGAAGDTGDGIGSLFNEGDAVTFTVTDDAIAKNKWLRSLNGISAVIQSKKSDGTSIVIPNVIIPGVDSDGDITGSSYSFTGLTVERRVPIMDFVIESGNRLWGCRYGENVAGVRVNEIYASKLGDFKNWNVYQGISTDSYAASVGSDGKFTGAISYRGYPHFFKERVLHKVMGSMPSSYQIMSTELEGVAERCGGSLAIVDNILYYKSRTGVCAYDGSFPTEMGAALGHDVYVDAAGGDVNGMYHLSMQKEGGSSHETYCFDTNHGIWSMEDYTKITHYCEHRGVLYYTDGASVYTVNGNGDETDFPWNAETGDIGIDANERKYINRLVIRMRLGIGARVSVSVCYDHSDEWEVLYEAVGDVMKTYNVNVRPKRRDHMRLRFDGIGECEIYSITKYLQYGSIY